MMSVLSPSRPTCSDQSTTYYDGIRAYLRSPAFTSDPEKCNIYVFDNTPNGLAHTFTSSERFESHIADTQKPSGRIVYVYLYMYSCRLADECKFNMLSELDAAIGHY